jgi:ubiquinone/menaquinone biosynthesis C-methylase UbiE
MLHRTILCAMISGAALCSSLDAQVRTPAPSQARVPERRDDWQRAPDIFAALGATAGSRIADVGAGEGWLTTRLAARVGPTGRVFAVDINEPVLRSLAERVQRDSLRNVELILSEEDDPRLPYASLDGVVILNAYHEMTQRVVMLEGIKRSLRPGGTLVIVDNTPGDTVRARREQINQHALALEFARDDLEAQGFEIVSVVPDFIRDVRPEHARRQWLIAARLRTK